MVNKMSSCVYRFYQTPGLSPGAHEVILSKLTGLVSGHEITNFATELCFYVNAEHELNAEEKEQLQRLFSKSFETDKTSTTSHLTAESYSENSQSKVIKIEIGPRLNFSTAFSTNAVSICQSVGLHKVDRIEQSRRYFIEIESKHGSKPFSKEEEQKMVDVLHDRMTECRYLKPIESFCIDIEPEEYYSVDVIGKGRPALEQVNKDLGLAFDDWDLDYYSNLFKERVGRNPTNVECFDLAQSNSEHSRHWFFRGRLVVDGKEIENSLMKMVIKTQETSNDNNVIKFSDNSSAIKGFEVPLLKPYDVKAASKFLLSRDSTRHIIFSAETHNFPTGVAPFPGATTGTGGRIRDVQAAGRGAHVVAGTAGYCFGNLHIPGYELPWEEDGGTYPSNMAPALDVAVQASNGASDYGNKFGEPIVTGFARSFGMNMAGDERREWIKPIMFSGGMGMLDAENILKLQPEIGMEVVKVGGPVYRIGVGGGAASSIQVQGDNVADLDFGAVQRGDAEMEQKMNRAIRACLEMGANPICSIHDQGAGGNGNVLKEICEPAGAVIRAQDFILGDPTLSILELWGAEYQESNALLVKREDIPKLKEISLREKVPISVVGSITGDGRIVLEDSKANSNGQCIEDDFGKASKRQKTEAAHPVDLELDVVLGKMPKKVFNLDRVKSTLKNLELNQDLSVHDALNRVLRLPSVASKRYLTNKVDRSVTGLIAQQQCVGPLHTPLADVAVTALSHYDIKGSATAIGEQPIKMLVDPTCGARMTVGEALTNLVFAKISDLKDVKCSANWMWAAKLPGEGAALYDACHAMCDVMAELGIAVDGGKDSLSMAARVGKRTVKAPGALVVSVYAACPDIRQKVTPDLKLPGKGKLVYVDMSNSKKYRLGGSALAQVFNQIGDTCPDLDDVKSFVAGFNVTQSLIAKNLISSGHDVSDGGLVTTLLEMAFAGNSGLEVDLNYMSGVSPCVSKAVDLLFAEELGLVLEVSPENLEAVLNSYKSKGVSCYVVGQTGESGDGAGVSVTVDGSVVLQEKMVDLRDTWEATSFQLERLQCNPRCVEAEEAGLRLRKAPPYKLSFQPEAFAPKESNIAPPQIAVIREEGSNGDREMVAAFHMAGFEVWDVTMTDICNGSVKLSMFRGVVFVGGFSYADVLGSAKGWAAVCQMNETARQEFEAFFSRYDTFSLGICNGCQLMGLLGWIGSDPNGSHSELCPTQGVCFTHNTSERFESRFVTVSIEASPAIMLKGMEGSTLGVWVAHGEGRAEFRRPDILQAVISKNLAPVRYVDDDGKSTMQYPLNPNGAPEGIAALCSPNGRHLAMMPHPERCTLLWQWPWMPEDWRQDLKASPWLKMFCNAYDWCLEQSHG